MNLWYEITKTEQVIYIFAAIATAMLFIDVITFLKAFKTNTSKKDMSLFNSIFNLRSFLAFLSVGLWSTILSYKVLGSYIKASIIGFVVGVVVAVVFSLVFRYVINLPVLAKVDIHTLIGKKGVVYSLILAKGEGKGKVSVVVDEKMCVFNAIAYEDNKIISGKDVKIVDVLGRDLLLVESLQEE